MFTETTRFCKSSSEDAAGASLIFSLASVGGATATGGCLEMEGPRNADLRFGGGALTDGRWKGLSVGEGGLKFSAGSQPSEPFGCCMMISLCLREG